MGTFYTLERLVTKSGYSPIYTIPSYIVAAAMDAPHDNAIQALSSEYKRITGFRPENRDLVFSRGALLERLVLPGSNAGIIKTPEDDGLTRYTGANIDNPTKANQLLRLWLVWVNQFESSKPQGVADFDYMVIPSSQGGNVNDAADRSYKDVIKSIISGADHDYNFQVHIRTKTLSVFEDVHFSEDAYKKMSLIANRMLRKVIRDSVTAEYLKQVSTSNIGLSEAQKLRKSILRSANIKYVIDNDSSTLESIELHGTKITNAILEKKRHEGLLADKDEFVVYESKDVFSDFEAYALLAAFIHWKNNAKALILSQSNVF